MSSVSALIITHCDRENVKTRQELKLNLNSKQIQNLLLFQDSCMRKGIVTVGLPSDLEKTNNAIKHYQEDQMQGDKKRLVTMVKEVNNFV